VARAPVNRGSFFLGSFLLLMCSLPLLSVEPGREQARSMTINRLGIVASSQTLASQAGAAVLERGGSAVDAAIAANAALGVIEPMMNGVGGDLFAIVYNAKTKSLYGLNASGWAPKGMTIAYLKAKGAHHRDALFGNRFGYRSRRRGRLGGAA
jgi:gamma-glutamyltranspeptidase/glutathione hydrolase